MQAVAPLVVFTRPSLEQAQPWMEAVREQGWDACNVPLIQIEPNHEAREQVQTTVARLTTVSEPVDGQVFGHMFVSANAVHAARELLGESLWQEVLAQPRHLLFATGPGTVRALLAQREQLVQQGIALAETDFTQRLVHPNLEGSQFDSETLWQCVMQRGLHTEMTECVIYRGVDVERASDEAGKVDGKIVLTQSKKQFSREWLSDTIREQGITVDAVPVYKRSMPTEFTPPADVQWQDVPRIWVFSSSLAVKNWRRIAHPQDTHHAVAWWNSAEAGKHELDVVVCTHKRIAQVVADCGLALMSTPQPQAIVQAIRAFLADERYADARAKWSEMA